MPACVETTAPISSSVCRLPFISASTLPEATSATAFSAEFVAVFRIDDLKAGDIEARKYGDIANAAGGADEDRLDQAQPLRLDGAFQRNLVAGMGHRNPDPLFPLRGGDQALVFVMAGGRALSGGVNHGGLCIVFVHGEALLAAAPAISLRRSEIIRPR